MNPTTPPPEPARDGAPQPTGPTRWLLWGHRPAAVAGSTVHVLLDLPLAVLAFVATVVLGALGLGLLIVYPVALPVLAGWVVVVRGLAAFERARVRALLGFGLEEPTTPPRSGSWHRRLWAAVRHHTTWRAFVYHLARLPLAVLVFTFAVVAWSLPLSLFALPLSLVGASLPLVPVWLLVPTVLAPLLGLVLVPVAVVTVDALAQLDAAVAGSLLGVSAADRRDRRIAQLSTTRSDLVDIAEQERRRIERDLHDGAGQQLVSLAMTLGMAKEKLRQDPAGAQSLIDEAHAEAKQAMVGLRDIVRGISPAILTDRGLGAALSAVAARASVPVNLLVEVPDRPDQVTEGIAYYVLCEAIGNATRHADASEIRVTVARRDDGRRGDTLDIEVRDDGRGGADPDRGTGLHGLAARVAAVDGDLSVTSPPGGPTVLRASLPVRAGDTAPAER